LSHAAIVLAWISAASTYFCQPPASEDGVAWAEAFMLGDHDSKDAVDIDSSFQTLVSSLRRPECSPFDILRVSSGLAAVRGGSCYNLACNCTANGCDRPLHKLAIGRPLLLRRCRAQDVAQQPESGRFANTGTRRRWR